MPKSLTSLVEEWRTGPKADPWSRRQADELEILLQKWGEKLDEMELLGESLSVVKKRVLGLRD